VTSQRVGVERNRLPEPMVFQRPISHSFDYIGMLRQKFFPTPIRIDFREQDGSNRFLCVFREFLSGRVGFIKKVAHARAF